MYTNPERMKEYLKPFLVIIGMAFIIIQIYSIFFKEEEDNDFVVTIEYDCKGALAHPTAYPERVVVLCEQLRNEN